MTHHLPFATELWPGGLQDGSRGQRVYLPVTRQGTVRALVPADVPRVAQSAVRNASAPQTRRQLVQRAATGGGLRAALHLGLPLVRRAVVSSRDDGLETMLAGLLGLEKASIAVHFGPPRANMKPVVKIYDDRSAEACAVAKFGCTPLTRRLVAQEAAVLRAVGGLTSSALEIPQLLHEGTWGDSTFVMQSVIRFSGRHRPPSPERRLAAERLVAATGVRSVLPLGAQSYHADLGERLLGMGDDDASRAVASAGRRLLDALGDARVATGGWHGDWAPQNLCATSLGVGSWDWERWAPDRPCGFDALHYRAQELLSRSGRSPSVGADLIDVAPTLLAPHQPGLPPAVSRQLAALYLVEIGHRYLSDRQRDTPSAAGRMDTWLVPALLSAVDEEPHNNELR